MSLEYTDTVSDINPLAYPDLLWEYTKEYLKQYKVSYYKNAPQVPIKGNTITWKILNRKPGNLKRERQNPQPIGQTRLLDNTVVQHYEMLFTIMVEFHVYSTSSSTLEDLAWDFENTLLNSARAEILMSYPAFDIKFVNQEADSIVEKSDLERIRLQFQLIVPVNFQKIYRKLTGYEVQLWGHKLASIDVPFTNTSLETFEIPLNDNTVVCHIISIKRDIGNDEDLELLPGTDYKIEINPTTGSRYITWIENGSIPELNEEFWVTYTTVTKLATSQEI